MAVTGFWPVKGNLKSVIEYADNPDKTTPQEYLDDDLCTALRYVKNDDKTDKQIYVGGINCSKQNAYAEMVAVQKRFGNHGSIVAYHGIQSFAQGEVTPDEAFEIGKETARRMWGDKYQVLVTVHLNTDNVHCHFVVNPVSFKDGKKFKNKIGDHMELRKISDEICREHELSVLENSSFYGGQKGAYWIHNNGGKTHRDILKKDVEICIEASYNFDDFIRNLKRLGYEVNPSRGSVKSPDWERAIRLTSVGFTAELLENRFYKNFHSPKQYKTYIPVPKQRPLIKLQHEYEYEVRHLRSTGGVLVALVFLLIIRLLEAARERRELQAQVVSIRMEYAHINELKSQYQFLIDNKIYTDTDLTEAISNAKAELNQLEEQRKKEYSHIRRLKDDKDMAAHKQKRSELSEQIKPLRNFIKTAEKIDSRYKELIPMLDMEIQMERASMERSLGR